METQNKSKTNKSKLRITTLYLDLDAPTLAVSFILTAISAILQCPNPQGLNCSLNGLMILQRILIIPLPF